MTEQTYLGVIERGSGNFGIVFPDFAGCVSVGESLDHVLAMGREALALHIAGMVEDGETIPTPSEISLDRIKAEQPEGDWIALGAVTVPIPMPPDKVLVSLPTELVREVDRITPNRRQFIENAARRELDRLKTSA